MPLPANPLSAAESRTLDALFDRMFPRRRRHARCGGDRRRELCSRRAGGPYAAHLPEYRAVLVALDAAAGGYAGASAVVQDDLLAAFAADTLSGLPRNPDRSAFDLVWRHLREGLFCDPAHGGNRDAAG